MNDVVNEKNRAIQRFPAINSPHEGYAVILEELDEAWDEIKKSPRDFSDKRLYDELVQVAAMAARTAIDCELNG